MKIIFGQGNPGVQYKNNRHNLGFMVLDRVAGNYKLEFKKNSDFKADIAELLTPNEKILLVKPLSFYNNSGEVAEKLLKYYKLDASSDLLVIHDELMLSLGSFRVRASGRDAGNNGIKSLNKHLGQNYHRVRIGIENELRPQMDADEFVLSNFSKEEAKKLSDEIIPHVTDYVDSFIAGDPEIISKSL